MLPSKITSRIVLIGGGHSHVQFLKSWRENPIPEVEVYLLSRDAWTPYSGMLPSRLAGWYSDPEMHFDLLNLCAQSGVIFLSCEVTGMDVSARRIFLRDRPPLSYDVASINCGITPALPAGAAGNPHVLVVKPISELLEKWEKFDQRAAKSLTVVGGGSAGFELAVICKQLSSGEVTLIEAGERILPAHSRAVQAAGERILRTLGIKVWIGKEIASIETQNLVCKSGEKIAFDRALITTGASAPAWLEASGLPVDDSGFVRIDENLRVEGLQNLFAAGDCAHFTPRSLPKSGVYAVREGPVLVENLRRAIRGEQRLKPYRPQKRTLSLLVSGPRRALLSYRGLAFEGGWVWRWKDRIDRRFMQMFGAGDVQPMSGERNTCGGCGGKVSAEDVRELVAELKRTPAFARLLPEQVEDVGVIGNQVSTVDGFRSFTRDLYFFGQVAVWHSLNDLFASGVKPNGITLYAGMPEARPRLRRNQMLHLMSGVLRALNSANVPLLNAHSAEAADVQVVVGGSGVYPGQLWSKAGLRAGDSLILTRELGTGVLLQAQMNGALPPAVWHLMNERLLQNHARLADRLWDFPVHACTDITGFGLGGHLCEMLTASKVGARISLTKLPVLAEFFELEKRGFRPHLASENQAAFVERIDGADSPILWDPQTHGPLLFSVSLEKTDQFLDILREEGFASATVIGNVVPGKSSLTIE